MYPVLILRAEIICLIILLFMTVNSARYKLGKNNKVNNYILYSAVIHVILDIVTVLTVNNLDIQNSFLNKFLHVLFYISAMYFSTNFLRYVLQLCYPKYKFKTVLSNAYLVIFAIYALVAPKGIIYNPGNGTYSSYGPAAIIGFATAFIELFIAMLLMIFNNKKIKNNVMYTLFPTSVITNVLIIVQILVPEFLATGMSVTLLCVGLFFSNENPAQVFQQKNKIEAINKMMTNVEFEEKMKEYNEDFEKDKTKVYSFIKCSIQQLAEVNNRLGHSVGDDYIANVINRIFVAFNDALAIGRSSGSEVIVVYKGLDEDAITKRIKAFNVGLKASGTNLPYEPKVSCGYSLSAITSQDLNEVLKATEFSLYNAKNNDMTTSELIKGVSIDTTGLNNFMFDAVALADETNWPYIINLSTNVARISKSWAERFDFPNEIIYDFPTVWTNCIHPNDRKGFVDDFTETFNGNKPEHHYDYLALDKYGKYIKCSCHGKVFVIDEKTTLFAGHMYLKEGK